jgi:hypothetical protein
MWGAALSRVLLVAETDVLQKTGFHMTSVKESLTLSDLKKRDVLKIA